MKVEKNKMELKDENGLVLKKGFVQFNNDYSDSIFVFGEYEVEFIDSISIKIYGKSENKNYGKPDIKLKKKPKKEKKVLTKEELEKENQIEFENDEKLKKRKVLIGKKFKSLVGSGNESFLKGKIEENEENEVPVDAFVLNPDAIKERKVYLEAFLSRELRKHQKEGIKFMFKCVVGQEIENNLLNEDDESDCSDEESTIEKIEKARMYYGCLLGDDMGMGKTAQVIGLIWTLLNQSNLKKDVGLVRKVIIITNSSLIGHWRNEFRKWLGGSRLKPLVCESGKTNGRKARDIFSDFKGLSFPVLIVSYGLVSLYVEDLCAIKSIDLLICDEGHKLKSEGIKVFKSINSIPAQKRIVITGTPIQNNMEEFFSIVQFVNPGLFSSNKVFKQKVGKPIEKGREKNSSETDKRISEEILGKLSIITSKFMIRRTMEIVAKDLPKKIVMSVFLRMTDAQTSLYSKIIEEGFGKADTVFNALGMVQTLKKVLSHPVMVTGSSNGRFLYTESSKFILLRSLILQFKETREKCVIVSNFTSMLDCIESLLNSMEGINFLRLDGTVAVSKRMELVDLFNREANHKYSVFLLSARAGREGLNLTAASRLIMFEPDWNPSVDFQAMGRIYRDGQTRPVFIYRFLCSGTVEEKILQRQISKTHLFDRVIDDIRGRAAKFSPEELKALFSVPNEDCVCETYENELNGFSMKDLLLRNDAVFHKVFSSFQDETKKLVSFVKVHSDEEEEKMLLRMKEFEENQTFDDDDDRNDLDYVEEEVKKNFGEVVSQNELSENKRKGSVYVQPQLDGFDDFDFNL